ncbi:hypothetical protein NLJ89_g5678 [Agrocybe chaxingu]|uniref:GPI-anchored wall transfer protein n=1 Tax=Agrocybe chaxingu TaxID=84603 RepID=A0A9W8K0M0_9AGAR|nr:hypothetical protein NLJ89_g5678 [Agrocybe chaxingu]
MLIFRVLPFLPTPSVPRPSFGTTQPLNFALVTDLNSLCNIVTNLDVPNYAGAADTYKEDFANTWQSSYADGRQTNTKGFNQFLYQDANLRSIMMKCLPIIAMGVVRVLLMKGAEYPEHVTEYGVHWNFFITLTLLPVLQVFLHPIFQHVSISTAGTLVALVQQITLSKFGLKDYVLFAPQTSLISANSTLILPPSPNFFSQRQKALLSNGSKERKRKDSNMSSSASKELDLSAPRQLGKTAVELCAYSIVWWTALDVTRFIEIGEKWSRGEGGVSRQMVNLPYILWVVAFNTSFLLSYIVVLDIWIFSESKEKSTEAKHRQITSPKKSQGSQPLPQDLKATSLGSPAPHLSPFSPISLSTLPAYLSVPSPSRNLAATSTGNPSKLLEVINKHGLTIFLLANVLTDLINLSCQDVAELMLSILEYIDFRLLRSCGVRHCCHVWNIKQEDIEDELSILDGRTRFISTKKGDSSNSTPPHSTPFEPNPPLYLVALPPAPKPMQIQISIPLPIIGSGYQVPSQPPPRPSSLVLIFTEDDPTAAQHHGAL